MRGSIHKNFISLQYRNYVVIYRRKTMLVGVFINGYIVCFKRIRRSFKDMRETLNAMVKELRVRK